MRCGADHRGRSRGDGRGSRTQFYSVTAAVVVVAVVVLARPLLAAFPLAALAAIVIYAATRLIDVQAFRKLVAFAAASW